MLCVIDGRIVTCGDVIHIWNLETCTIDYSIQVHTAPVLSAVLIKSHPTRIVSSSADHTMKVWQLNTREYIHMASIKSKTRNVRNMTFTKGKHSLAIANRKVSSLDHVPAVLFSFDCFFLALIHFLHPSVVVCVALLVICLLVFLQMVNY